MYLIRDVFRCKPGKAGELAQRFKRVISVWDEHDGFKNGRVMIDFVANYWTVVLQAEVEELAQFEGHMKSYGSRPEFKEAMAGYTDLVESGYREIYRIV